jgi:hypothetical protein
MIVQPNGVSDRVGFPNRLLLDKRGGRVGNATLPKKNSINNSP